MPVLLPVMGVREELARPAEAVPGRWTQNGLGLKTSGEKLKKIETKKKGKKGNNEER